MSWSVSDERLDATLRELLIDRVDAIATEALPMDEFVTRVSAGVQPVPVARRFGGQFRLALVLALALAAVVAGAILVAGAMRQHHVLAGNLATISGSTVYVGRADAWTQVPVRPEVKDHDFCCSLAWSPDGKTLAVWSGSGLEVVDADTGDSQVLVAATTILGPPAWAPDGSALALAMADTQTPGAVRIGVVAAAGGSPRFVTPAFSILHMPAWSHDGRTLAFGGQSRDQAVEGLYTVGRDGTDLRLVNGAMAPGLAIASQGPPAWSPDDATIVVDAGMCTQQCTYRIAAVRLSDGAATRLTADAVNGFGPSWSPDGQRIAFYEWQDGPGPANLWTMRPDGGDAQVLIKGTAFNDPAWTPDGRLLYFAEDTGNDVYAQLWSMQADGSDKTLVSTKGDIEGIAVRPLTP